MDSNNTTKCTRRPGMRLDLFDGEAAAGGEGAQTAPAGNAAGTPDSAPAKGSAGREPDGAQQRQRAWRALADGEYQDLYAQDMQHLSDRHKQEIKALEDRAAQIQPVLDLLLQRYRIEDGDLSRLAAAVESDDAWWRESAEKEGMSVEQLKQLKRLERENQQLQRWKQQQKSQQAAQLQLQQWTDQAQAMRESFPQFDLAQEARDPRFLALLRSGVPVEHAYKVLHMDEIVSGAARQAAKTAEKQVVAKVRAKGARPQEAGTADQSAFTVREDVHRLTPAQRAECVRRAAEGEVITFV